MTYVFIGVIPLILLATLALTAFYLFAGQFATFVVTSGLSSELRGVGAANTAIAHELATRFRVGGKTDWAALDALRKSDKAWADRQISVWLDGNLVLNSAPAGMTTEPPKMPGFLKPPFRDV
ncbi:MAG: hypothetical protein DMG68_21350, partial [Acidobacteria bacterium]